MVTGAKFEVECEVNIFEHSLIPLNPVTNPYMKSKNNLVKPKKDMWFIST